MSDTMVRDHDRDEIRTQEILDAQRYPEIARDVDQVSGARRQGNHLGKDNMRAGLERLFPGVGTEVDAEDAAVTPRHDAQDVRETEARIEVEEQAKPAATYDQEDMLGLSTPDAPVSPLAHLGADFVRHLEGDL